eukprot:CAMPEP_0116844474 /NCGR_PEP_ID=MMETSP0418-20121206/12713_1 /TAXON_ID=1158023 /ORGANISM="Astrosyne radiata, Strain 13vi08-1A" /LENGTH=56 /DNA_ID=CAMNT_0004475441 /DNA_START=548 /DNA_END=715 /DNA_ORIENTATION=+
MMDPVVATDEHTNERSAIERVPSRTPSSPVSWDGWTIDTPCLVLYALFVPKPWSLR